MVPDFNLSGDNSSNYKRKSIALATVGVVLVFVLWILHLSILKIPFSLSGLTQIHKENPSLWVINLLPFLLALYGYHVHKKNHKHISHLEKEIQQRHEDIDKNAHFAKTIGQGDYNAPFEVSDEDDVLGKSLLLMRQNLLESNTRDAEQSWISKGKEEVSFILRLHNNLDELTYEVLVKLIDYVKIVQGALYLFDEDSQTLTNLATYAYSRKKYVKQQFRMGEGLIGQCAYEKDIIYRTEIPQDYVTISSGVLGDQKPRSLILVPLITDEKLQGVLEFASVNDHIPLLTRRFLQEVGEIIARTIFNLRINEQTSKLLMDAQQMTEELQENEEELRQNAEEMRATHEELEKSNLRLEAKVQEVEDAQKRLHSLLENASEIISIYSSSRKLVYISPSVTKILGFTPEEMMAGKDLDRLTRKGESDLNQMFQKLLQNPLVPITIQYTYMKKSGEKIFLEITGRNLLNDSAINGIILNSQDITERKRAEKEERMRSQMQALSENSPDMIMRLNLSGQLVYANPMVETYLGLPVRSLVNQFLRTIEINPLLSEFLEESIKTIKKDKIKLEQDLSFDSLMGEVIMHISAIPEFNENELETVLFVGHDITEAKRIEKEIQDTNRKITESINYAQRIQTSILPSIKLIGQYLPKSFVYYQPRDVVSGDFPWFFVKGDYAYISAVDCTGHGVPGALLSFIGYFLLNNIVDHDISYTAAEILDSLHFNVRKTLKQDRPDADARDGMDLAFCKIDLKNRVLDFAGAHRPLYFIRDGELIQYKGDRKAIGGIPHPRIKEDDFTNHHIELQEGDKIFFFSDGLPDQNGGEKNKKFGPARIRELILCNLELEMPEYHLLFKKEFEEHKGSKKQIDDVLMIGIEF